VKKKKELKEGGMGKGARSGEKWVFAERTVK